MAKHKSNNLKQSSDPPSLKLLKSVKKTSNRIKRLYDRYKTFIVFYLILVIIFVVGLFLVFKFNLKDNPESFIFGITLVIIGVILMIKKCIEFLYSFYNTSIVYNIILFFGFVGFGISGGIVVVDKFNLAPEDHALLIVVFITAVISFMLMLEQHRVAEAQEKSNIEQRYNYAINQIESEIEGVVRIGFKNLHQLALEGKSEYRRERICDVFCDYLKAESGVEDKMYISPGGIDNLKEKISPETVQFILGLLIKKKNGKEIPFSSKWLDLSKVHFQGADLNNANLEGVQLQEANLSNVQLQEANLKGAKLDNAKLHSANLTGAKNLTATQLQRVKDSNLERVHLSGIDLNNGDFLNFNLKNVDLQRANLKSVILDNAQLHGANFTGAKNLNASQFENIKGLDLTNTTLADLDLNDGDFSNFKLKDADLQRTNLKGVKLDNAELQGADFTNAKGLTAAQFDKANPNMEGVCLAGLDLSNGNFSNFKLNRADFREADLKGITLDDAEIQGANFTGVKNFTAAQLDKANPNMQGVCLAGLNLSGGNFSNFKLNNARLEGAKLGSAQLQGANLENAQLQGADLGKAQFQGADLGKAQFQGANLGTAQLQGADLGKAQFQGANLGTAQLQGANLSGAQLQGADLWKTQFQGTDLSRAQFQGAKFDDTNFSGVYTDNPIIFLSTNLKRAVARLKDRSGKPDKLKNVVFSGGVTNNDLPNFKRKRTDMEKVLTDINYGDINQFRDKMDEVEEVLKENIGEPKDNSIPSQVVITGIYPKADADKVIEDLKKIINDLEALKKSN